MSLLLKYVNTNDLHAGLKVMLAEGYDEFKPTENRNINKIKKTNEILEPYVNKYMGAIGKDKIINKQIQEFLLSNKFTPENETDFFNRYNRVGPFATLVHIDRCFEGGLIMDNKLYHPASLPTWVATDKVKDTVITIVKSTFISEDDSIHIYSYLDNQIICWQKSKTFYFPT
jgi:hypothetical protein